jgi:predicted RNA polymerase sigma factor
MAEGPAHGLVLAEKLLDEPALAGYPHLAAVRATFLQRLGRLDEAALQFQQAAEHTSNDSERRPFRRQARHHTAPDQEDRP